MAIRQYRDLILVGEAETGPDGAVEAMVVSVFDSPVGQGEKRERVTIPDGLDREIRRLENRVLDEEPAKQIELGEALAALLLPPYARRMVAESLARLGPEECLRLRLRLDDRLANFPWEYAYVAGTRGEKNASGFLALDSRISMARHEALPIPGDWFDAPAKRRVVVAMATPKPYNQYRRLEFLPREQRAIQQALAQVAGVEAEFVPLYADENGEPPGATIRQLAAALEQRADVFHFSGHGEFAQSLSTGDADGALIFADSNNEAVPVSSERLAELLRYRGVRLAVLGACEGGRRDGINVWAGVAAALLRAGTPAVVAMQFTIDDQLAAAFSTGFYRALVAGCTVDEALSSGRAAIRLAALETGKNTRDWGVPVLYLRSPGGAIFNPVKDADAVAQGAKETAQLVEQHVREVGSTGRLIGALVDSLGPGESIGIDQRIDGEQKGFALGGSLFRLEGGRITVKQVADVVSGTMVGLRIGRSGGGRPADTEKGDAISQLEALLRFKQERPM